MKLFVAFSGSEEQARFVVLIDGAETVAALRRRIVADFRAVFPARPPLCFFRMSNSDGFFLTDSAVLADVLDQGGAVMCHRADQEAVDRPLPEDAAAEDIEDVLSIFRAQVAYVARAACHAALRVLRPPAGASARAAAGVVERRGSEAMSVILSMLLLGGDQLVGIRAEALCTLQRALGDEGAATAATLPAFIAAGGLFVLLSLLSPSTRMDASPEVLEGAAQLLERLALAHGDALAPVLKDCHPSTLLQKLSLDSRATASVQRKALAAQKALERGGALSARHAPGPLPSPPPPPRRPRSGAEGGGGSGRSASLGASDRLRAAGAAALGGAGDGGGYSPSRSSSRAGGASPALCLRTLLEHAGSDPELQQRMFERLDAVVGSTEELRDLARITGLLDVVIVVLRSVGPRPNRSDTAALAPLSRLLMRALADAPCRGALARRMAELLSGKLGSGVVDTVKAVWPVLPAELRSSVAQVFRDTFGVGDGGDGFGGGVSADGFCVRPSFARAPTAAAAVVGSLLDSNAPEELQAVALQALRVLLESGTLQAALEPLTTKTVNAALLRLIPKQPLLCLDALATLALHENFRVFFGAQPSLLQFLAQCCQQPEAVTGSSGGLEVSTLQRAAARSLANLSSLPAAREWVKRSRPLRAALASTEDFAVRAYLGMALGADASGAALLP